MPLNPYEKYALSGEASGDDRQRLYRCAGCGESICEGDTYYDLLEGDFCKECMENFRRVAWE